MEAFTVLQARTVAIPATNIDTDQIIPARFLKVTDKLGLGEKAFCDWRYDAEGRPNPEFILNQEQHRDAQILVAGDNFGCGSSREHAPWALVDFGFRAVISTSIADIFRNNALKNGLLPVVVDEEVHDKLLAQAGSPITIDLEKQTLELADGTRTYFTVEPFARLCMLRGQDQLDYLLHENAAITAFEETYP